MAEALHILSFAFIFIALVESILAYKLATQGREASAARVDRLCFRVLRAGLYRPRGLHRGALNLAAVERWSVGSNGLTSPLFRLLESPRSLRSDRCVRARKARRSDHPRDKSHISHGLGDRIVEPTTPHRDSSPESRR